VFPKVDNLIVEPVQKMFISHLK